MKSRRSDPRYATAPIWRLWNAENRKEYKVTALIKGELLLGSKRLRKAVSELMEMAIYGEAGARRWSP